MSQSSSELHDWLIVGADDLSCYRRGEGVLKVQGHVLDRSKFSVRLRLGTSASVVGAVLPIAYLWQSSLSLQNRSQLSQDTGVNSTRVELLDATPFETTQDYHANFDQEHDPSSPLASPDSPLSSFFLSVTYFLRRLLIDVR